MSCWIETFYFRRLWDLTSIIYTAEDNIHYLGVYHEVRLIVIIRSLGRQEPHHRTRNSDSWLQLVMSFRS